MQNLVLNAVQAQPDGGRIRISSRSLEGGVLIQIADDGPGIATDVADKMFSPFYTTKTAGSGLGLTISSRILAAHGGFIDIDSQPGQTTVWLCLPRDRR